MWEEKQNKKNVRREEIRQIDKINPILNGHKTVSYTNIKLPHFPST